jgi:hypothetical protein
VLFSLAFDLESGGADLLSVFEKAFEGFENAVDVFLRQVCAVRNAEFNLIDVYGARRADDKIRVSESFDSIVQGHIVIAHFRRLCVPKTSSECDAAMESPKLAG